jgi:hypothetical protein
MSKTKYAYLKGQTWLYRRNYPEDVALLLGSKALKQSLKTGDAKTAASRAAEVNRRYETVVERVRRGPEVAVSAPDREGDVVSRTARLRDALVAENVNRHAILTPISG